LGFGYGAVFEIAAGGGPTITLASFSHADSAYPVGSLIEDALALGLRAGNLHRAILSQTGREKTWVSRSRRTCS
jgi:hypothetical protein